MSTTEMMRQAWRGEPSGDAEWDFGVWTNPIIGAPMVYVTGVVLYMLDIGWFWPLVAGVLFASSFYGSARRRGLRRLGIAYTVTSSTVATGWLFYASFVLTFNVLDMNATLQHVIAGLVITVPLTVVWGLLVRDAGQARVQQYMARQGVRAGQHEWDDYTRAAGIKDWSTQDVTHTDDAVTATMRIAPGGTTYRQAIARIDALEIACNAAFPGAIRMEQPRGAGVATVVIRKALRSTLAETVPVPPVPTEPKSILDPIVDARFDDGEMSSRVHAYQTTIILGQRDSGKTGLQNVRVDAYAQCSNVLLLAIDFKEGRWLRPWLEPYATGQVKTPVFRGIGTTVATVNIMLDGLIGIGEHRGRATSGDKITPTNDMPAIRLEIDEVADLLADPQYQRVADKLIMVVRKLRSEGIDIDVASQRGTMSFLGARARDLLSQSTIVDLLRVDSAAEVYNALSIPADKLGSVDPTVFEYPGTKLTLARKARLAAARTINLEPQYIPGRAAHYANWRPILEPDATRAADKATNGQWSKIMEYQTGEARAVLAGAAMHANDLTAAQQWIDNTTPRTPHTNSTTTEPASTKPAPTTGGSTRDRLIAEHGETDGENMWQRARGRMLLIAARSIIGTHDHILTKDLLDALAATDPERWSDLNPKTLATLVGHHGVEGVKIRAENNARGYTRAAVEEAFTR